MISRGVTLNVWSRSYVSRMCMRRRRPRSAPGLAGAAKVLACSIGPHGYRSILVSTAEVTRVTACRSGFVISTKHCIRTPCRDGGSRPTRLRNCAAVQCHHPRAVTPRSSAKGNAGEKRKLDRHPSVMPVDLFVPRSVLDTLQVSFLQLAAINGPFPVCVTYTKVPTHVGTTRMYTGGGWDRISTPTLTSAIPRQCPCFNGNA